tara:strand:- start:664 stop:1179 length:516 start_codon:yes stop_codon:yes gene_type:complete
MLHIPYYLHGNWKLNTNELQTLEKNLLVKENYDEDKCLYTTFSKDNKHLNFLKSFYQNIVDEIAKEQTFFNTSEIEYNFWVQMYNNKAHHNLHTHFGINNNVIISWVHFLRVPETKCFRFTDGTNYLIPQQEEGDLLVFPSYCRHQVIQHNSNINRIVVAGNISLLEHKCD